MSVTAPTLANFRRRIECLPDSIELRDIQCSAFLLDRDGTLAVYYAPLCDAVNRNARVMLVGLTPGWTQTQIAFEACRQVLGHGGSEEEALAAAKGQASFAGMRTRLCRWLDRLGVEKWLGIKSTEELFDTQRDLVQTTSLIRYPVFVGQDGRNYRGSGRRPIKSALLWSIIESIFVPQLAELPGALVVPMGVAVSGALRELVVDPARCLYGFPHPSGANGHGPRQFEQERVQMQRVVDRLPRL
jgi:hypothetical protein